MLISQENTNAVWPDLVTMVPESNYFVFMQTDYQDGRQGPLLKKSIHTKMTISQEPLIEIDPTLCQNVSCLKLF